MEKPLHECLDAFEREAKRLDFEFDRVRFMRDVADWLGIGGASCYIKYENWYAWAYDVTVYLKFVKRDGTEISNCKAEISWSSTGRSVSTALACIKLYERAIELAALAECIFAGVTMPSDAIPMDLTTSSSPTVP